MAARTRTPALFRMRAVQLRDLLAESTRTAQPRPVPLSWAAQDFEIVEKQNGWGFGPRLVEENAKPLFSLSRVFIENLLRIDG